jgi:hypothetical protein
MRFHRRLARRYGVTAFSYRDHLARCWRCVFTQERERHVYIVGKSGSGKSTVLFNLAMADIVAGEGVAVIDPHGDLAQDILDAIPRSRINDVCYLDAGETEYPVGFNPAIGVKLPRRPGMTSYAAAFFFSPRSSDCISSSTVCTSPNWP